MATICSTCGLPEDLCACGELAKDSAKIIVRLETRRFKKKGTMIEGLDPKLNDLERVARELKNKYACGNEKKYSLCTSCGRDDSLGNEKITQTALGVVKPSKAPRVTCCIG